MLPGWHGWCFTLGHMCRFFMIALMGGLAAGCAAEGAALSPDSGRAVDTGVAVDSGGALDSAVACDPSLTYASFGASFLSVHCGSCHSFSQSFVQSDATGLSGIVLEGFMPPGGGGLTTAERDQFANWLACGAP
jgi:hypothetical protein